MRRTKTFVVTREYNYFEPGTLVSPTEDCPFDLVKFMERVDTSTEFEVERTVEPIMAEDEDSVVFVKGHKYGVSGRYLREATK